MKTAFVVVIGPDSLAKTAYGSKGFKLQQTSACPDLLGLAGLEDPPQDLAHDHPALLLILA